MGDMLAAMLAADARSDSENSPSAAAQLAAGDVASMTAQEAAALGGMLAARARSSYVLATAVAVLQAVDSHPALCTANAQHAWFVPMLEVLLVPPEAAESRRFGIASLRRLSAVVTPLATAHAPSNTDFDSVVRAQNRDEPTPHYDRMHPLANLKGSVCR